MKDYKGYTTFNRNDVDASAEPMFFGEPVGVARYDQNRYPIFEKLIDRQHSYFWRPNEVELTTDAKEFQQLEEHEKHIFISNLSYQILLDSVQGRSPNVAFLKIVSLPELETWFETWGFSETIHSRSYTHIVRNLFPDPGPVFDRITRIPEIQTRAAAVTEDYDKLIMLGDLFALAGGFGQHTLNGVTYDCSEYNLKYQLLRTLVSVYCLEAIRFYVSFACSFSFAERGKMESCAKIIKLIAR